MPLVRDHNKKSYLLRYAAAGIPTPETLVTDTFESDTFQRWMAEHELTTVVYKPAWGASGFGVERLHAADLPDAQRRWESAEERRGVIVQEFIPEIAGVVRSVVEARTAAAVRTLRRDRWANMALTYPEGLVISNASTCRAKTSTQDLVKLSGAR